MKQAVLIFKNFYENYTGGSRTAFNLASLLDPEKFYPVVVTNKESELTEDLRRIEVRTYVVPQSGAVGKLEGNIPTGVSRLKKAAAETLAYNDRIAEILKEEKIAVVYARNIKGVLLTGFACRKSRVPLIWDIAIEKPARGFVPFLFLIGFMLSQRVVLEANFSIKQTFPRWQQVLFRKRFKVIPAAITPERAREFEMCNPKPWRKGEPFQLLNVATINPRKNQEMLIEALRRLVPEFPYLELHIVGPDTDQKYGAHLRQLAAQSGLVKNVFFHGWQSDVVKFINNSHLFVMASQNEGIPAAIMESMHAKLPVLSTACGGVPDTILNNQTGWITPINDVDAFTLRLRDILTHPEKLGVIAKNAREYVHREHDAKVWCRRYEDFFVEVIRQHQGK